MRPILRALPDEVTERAHALFLRRHVAFSGADVPVACGFLDLVDLPAFAHEMRDEFGPQIVPRQTP
jgi:hypothetical protein